MLSGRENVLTSATPVLPQDPGSYAVVLVGWSCCGAYREAPGLISVRGGVRSGDVMIDGVSSREVAAARSSRTVHGGFGWQQSQCGSRPRSSGWWAPATRAPTPSAVCSNSG